MNCIMEINIPESKDILQHESLLPSTRKMPNERARYALTV